MVEEKEKSRKFYNLSIKERLELLASEGVKREALDLLSSDSLPLELANRMIENVVGKISLPLGVLRGLKLNGKTYNVPMAIEEPSVIAAANKAAKMTLPSGFFGEADESIMTGQIQIVSFSKDALKKLDEKYEYINQLGASLASQMEKYGGGWRGFTYKILKGRRKEHLVVYFDVSVSDAMGANTINTIAEALSKEIEKITEGKSRLKIISNLSLKRMVEVKATWTKESMEKDCAKKGINTKQAIEGVLDAYELAQIDPYRVATNNKGIMNGIDAVALALGQDWRAIEAGAHTYSAINGLSPLASYSKDREGNIQGTIKLPLAVARVGGATSTLKHARAAFEILKVSSSQELAMVMASVGMANNFAAMYAMVTEGIQKGHMKLHAKNLAVLAGAESPEEIDYVSSVLSKEEKYTLDNAKAALKQFREMKHS